ncbi:hypothetical protein [Marinimicrobium locisalis]|uniref:hypothetical protein n=1 Tax=Marinimicrobium locisalis TaxID=546022 RepID=UPI003221BD14
MAGRNARVFEWLLLIIVIGVIVMMAVGVYTRMAADVQKLSFKLAAQNFETAVSGVRAQWYVQQSQGNVDYTVSVYEQLPIAPGEGQGTRPVTVYLNRQGWPVNTASTATAQDGTLETWECMELWSGLFYGAPSIRSEGQESSGNAVYSVSSVVVEGDQACRYRHLVDGPIRQYFDYLPRHGSVTVNSSPK